MFFMEDKTMLDIENPDAIQQLNDRINELRQELTERLVVLGQAYYEIYSDGSGVLSLRDKTNAVKLICEEIMRCEDLISQSAEIERCQNCHAELIAGADFCIHCGTKVVRRTPQPSCPKCGATAGTEDLFCITCGADLRRGKAE